jgi:hypothetical protein
MSLAKSSSDFFSISSSSTQCLFLIAARLISRTWLNFSFSSTKLSISLSWSSTNLRVFSCFTKILDNFFKMKLGRKNSPTLCDQGQCMDPTSATIEGRSTSDSIKKLFWYFVDLMISSTSFHASISKWKKKGI